MAKLFVCLFIISSQLVLQSLTATNATTRNWTVTDCKPSSPSSTNAQDKQALEDLYGSLGGVAWIHNEGWLRGDPCVDKWYGVCCNAKGRVTVLDLSSNQASGQLPSTISQLSELTVIHMYNNSLKGALPPELFTMPKLEVLDLERNLIYPGIPDNVRLPSIRSITLSSNWLHGYMSSEWDTPKLQYLNLSGNYFQGDISLSSGVGKSSIMPSLTILDMSTNFFNSFGNEIGQMRSLQKLILDVNQFNQGVNIPDDWAELRNLRELKLSNMKGSIPDWIGKKWTKLESISISNGQLMGGLPVSMCRLRKLKSINLSINLLSGVIPKCMCRLPRLTTLQLPYNKLIGTIPDCFHRSRGLTNFDFTANQLTGRLPRSLGRLPRLQSIQLSKNNLYGAVPSEYSHLADTITSFDISNNKINTVKRGLRSFFNAFIDSGKYCSLSNCPWTCPLPDYVNTTACGDIECSKCNTPDKHASCSACVADSQCGWCGEGGNCLPGSLTGPESYTCSAQKWNYAKPALCRS